MPSGYTYEHAKPFIIRPADKRCETMFNQCCDWIAADTQMGICRHVTPQSLWSAQKFYYIPSRPKTLPGFSFSKWRRWQCCLILNTGSGFSSTLREQQAWLLHRCFSLNSRPSMSLNIAAPTWSYEQRTAMTHRNFQEKLAALSYCVKTNILTSTTRWTCTSADTQDGHV